MKMKKNLTVLIANILAFQFLNAQTNPALLTNFRIDANPGNGYKISWNVANNEVAARFEIQKSIDGIVYTPLAAIDASQKLGSEVYSWNMENSEHPKLIYRLKMTSRGQDTYYSNTITVNTKTLNKNKVDILGNPVKDKLTLRFNQYENGIVEIRIIDLSGKVINDHKINNIRKNEIVNIPFNTPLACGMYVVEIDNGIERITNKFIKQ